LIISVLKIEAHPELFNQAALRRNPAAPRKQPSTRPPERDDEKNAIEAAAGICCSGARGVSFGHSNNY